MMITFKHTASIPFSLFFVSSNPLGSISPKNIQYIQLKLYILSQLMSDVTFYYYNIIIQHNITENLTERTAVMMILQHAVFRRMNPKKCIPFSFYFKQFGHNAPIIPIYIAISFYIRQLFLLLFLGAIVLFLTCINMKDKIF